MLKITYYWFFFFHCKINKKSWFRERYRASFFRFFKMKNVLCLTFFLYLCSTRLEWYTFKLLFGILSRYHLHSSCLYLSL